MESPTIYNRVVEFVAKQLWEPKGGLKPETRLAEDIGIAGQDGWEFMEAYAAEFHVDLTGFDCLDYFGPEAGLGCLWLLPFAKHLGIYDPRDSPRWDHPEQFEITIRELAEWAEAGRWSPRLRLSSRTPG